MQKRLEISILDAEPLKIEAILHNLLDIGVTHIHLDIGDTSFIPNITMGISYINAIITYNFHFDFHFMVSDPLLLIKQIKVPKNSTITVHYEIDNLENVITYIKKLGCKVGVALKPKTYIEHIEDVDKILIMTVEPGYGGQHIITECISKIKTLRRNFKGEIGVDGGINLATLQSVLDADYFVIGSCIFKSKNMQQCYNKLQKLISKQENNDK